MRTSKSLQLPPDFHSIEAAAKDTATAVEFNVWRSQRLLDLEIIHTNSHVHRYPPHLHDTLEIIWIRSGNCLLTCNDQVHEMETGEAGIIPPNEMHSGGGIGAGVEFIAIELPSMLLEQLFGEFSKSVYPAGNRRSFRLISKEKASSLLPILVRTLCADLPLDKLLYILGPILCQLLHAPPDSPPLVTSNMHPAVSKARAIIREQCADRVHLRQLAQRVELDMRYLISMFKLSIGITPHQFRIAMRVELARSLIERRVSLCEVAALAGFADQSHMNRHFRRQWGFTPGTFSESVVVRENIDL